MGRLFSLSSLSCSLPGLHWAFLGCTGTQLQPDDLCPCILRLRLLLSLSTSSQLICHCQQDQEIEEAEETVPHCSWSPWEAAAICSCLADRQSYLCRLKRKVAQASVVSALCTLSSWQALCYAAGPSHCPGKDKKWLQDCSAHTACEYTANQLPQMWIA